MSSVRWVFALAWRDARSGGRRLALFAAAMSLGIGALVAVTAFRAAFESAIRTQAKALLGADLVLSARRPFTPEMLAFIDSIPGDRARETNFNSMAVFPRSGATRLVQVRAVERGFPFYGSLDTVPPGGAARLHDGFHALVDQTLMIQHGLEDGDEVRIGRASFRVIGRLSRVPGETMATAIVAPRVYIPMAAVTQTDLIQMGSLVTYRAAFRLPPDRSSPEQVEAFIEPKNVAIRELGLRPETVTRRLRQLGRSSENLARFFGIVGFSIFVLGGVGVASAVSLHVRRKAPVVAVLRCLGARSAPAVSVFGIQTLAMGAVAAAGGIAAGVVIQALLPSLLRNFLPLEIDFAFSARAALEGLSLGLGGAFFFAALPLASLRRVTPLQAIREDASAAPRRDALRVAIWLGIFAAVAGFAWMKAGNPAHAAAFTGGLAAAAGLLAGAARLVMRLSRAAVRPGWPFALRQGLANLYRPHNQTALLIVALGLSAGLPMMIHLIHTTLGRQVALPRGEGQPNLAVFDAHDDQREALRQMIGDFGLPPAEETPIVTMRILEIKGRPTADYRGEGEGRIPNWALSREYRSTYRSRLTETESVLEGEWTPRAGGEGPAPISIEKDIAETLGVGVGDTITWDVQGVPVETRVASVRRVEWYRMQPNFFVVFPAGVLEEAPKFFVFTTRAPGPESSAKFQQAAVAAFPNVSTIDLSLVLETIDGYLGRVSIVLRFMSGFAVLAALAVLAGAAVMSRGERLREMALLRTLGATRAQLTRIMGAEYAALGAMAAILAAGLSTVAAWSVARFLLKVDFIFAPLPIAAGAAGAALLTLIVGVAAGRQAARRSPLEVLRQDS